MKKKKRQSILKLIKGVLRQYELDHNNGFVRGGPHATSRKDIQAKEKNTIRRIEDE